MDRQTVPGNTNRPKPLLISSRVISSFIFSTFIFSSLSLSSLYFFPLLSSPLLFFYSAIFFYCVLFLPCPFSFLRRPRLRPKPRPCQIPVSWPDTFHSASFGSLTVSLSLHQKHETHGRVRQNWTACNNIAPPSGDPDIFFFIEI